jgi:hypothetical protein
MVMVWRSVSSRRVAGIILMPREFLLQKLLGKGLHSSRNWKSRNLGRGSWRGVFYIKRIRRQLLADCFGYKSPELALSKDCHLLLPVVQLVNISPVGEHTLEMRGFCYKKVDVKAISWAKDPRLDQQTTGSLQDARDQAEKGLIDQCGYQTNPKAAR